jgi:uncharacterized membrane protein YwaF
MNDEDKVSLPGFFTILYFADVFTSLFAAMVWGDFPNTGAYISAWINSILLWIMFKIVVYLIIILFIKYALKYSKYAENILIAITVIYGIILLNTLLNVTIQTPVFNITPELYRSLNATKLEIIP